MPLSERLGAAMESIRDGALVVDVGTDHAYLPIELIRSKKAKRVIACDIGKQPLENARRNVERYRLSRSIELRLSDGLSAVNEDEAEDIVIAGMGGDLIARIIGDAAWLKNADKRLILQPMSHATQLRDWLAENGFDIMGERAIVDHRRLYSVMCVHYSGEYTPLPPEHRYVGKITPDYESGRRYYLFQCKRLREHAASLASAGQEHPEADGLFNVANAIEAAVNQQEDKK